MYAVEESPEGVWLGSRLTDRDRDLDINHALCCLDGRSDPAIVCVPLLSDSSATKQPLTINST